MAPDHIVALDVGTTSVRALVVDVAGRVVGRAHRALGARYPEPGWLEQSPDEMFEKSVEVARAAFTDAGLGAADMAALGLVSQRSTAIAWDAASGRALAPAIGWQDRRTEARVAELQARGIPINSLASATKFEWLVGHVDAVADAARAGSLRVCTPDAWLSARLSGGASFVTDPGHASCTALYDGARGDWSAPLLGLFGVERAWLPDVVPTSAPVAETEASLFGGPIPIAARAGDQQAATFAQGVHRRGQAKLTLGTSAMLNLHTGDTPGPGVRGFYPLPLWTLAGGERAFCLEGTVITAASAIDWLVALGLLDSARELDAVAASVPGADGVAFVPALQGLGSPFLDEHARGAFFGLTRGTTRTHVVRAVVEGIANRCVDMCEALPLERGPIRVDGGLAQSDVLMQEIADGLGRPLERAPETETTALGAALLAGLAVGLYSDVSALLARGGGGTRFEPRIDAPHRSERRAHWRRALTRAR